MARCVLIVDSDTGKLVDVAGNVREGGRYKKLVARMLSADKNPVLDYGANGGDRLEISNGGYPGEEVNIKAKVLKINGVPIGGSEDEGDYVSVSALQEAIAGLSVGENDTLEDVKSTLATLLERLGEIADQSNEVVS